MSAWQDGQRKSFDLTAFHLQIGYSYGQVVATLTIIETPTSTAFQINEPAPDEDEDRFLDSPASDHSASLLFQKKKSLDGYPPVEPELLIVKSRPITATICSTMKHLRAQAGRWSGFRGIALAVVYRLLEASLSGILASFASSTLLGYVFAVIVTNVALAGLDMTWTHIVISAPSTRPWWQRIPSLDRVKVIIIPTAIYTIAEQGSKLLPYAIMKAFSFEAYLHDPSSFQNATPEFHREMLAKWLLVLLVGIASYFLILIPATITLRRVQASMLPDEDESIVPFDRTFNGKVQPVVAGGSGAVSMLDAWKSFDWPAWIRYLKLQIKLVALALVTSIMFGAIVAGEIVMFKTGGKEVMDSPNPAI